MRIGRLLSQLGLCSRREAHDFIRAHQVEHDGARIDQINYAITYDDTGIQIYVNNKEHIWMPNYEILLLNKPKGYVCSHRAFKKQKTIFSLLPDEFKNFFFAGRLDDDSHGLVVLSNDGDLIYELTHPSQKVKKTYVVKISRPLSSQEEKRCLAGVYDKKDKLRFNEIKTIRPALYEIILDHGKNREIRRLFKKLGLKVYDLQRISLGQYKLGKIAEGKFQKV